MTARGKGKPDELVDVREVRAASGDFDLRDGAVGELILEGYASTFEPYKMYGGPAEGGWIERLDRTAFDKTLRGKPDLHLLINHQGMPLARTKSGTLKLSVDEDGLRVRATLDRSDPDVQQIEPKMRRGDLDEMSFAFRVVKQRWTYAPGFEDDPNGLRVIEELSLHKGDVSVVNFGANPTTTAELLGRRRKSRGTQRSTLSLAEAQSLTIAGRKAIGATRRGAVPTRTIAEAQRIVARDNRRLVVGDGAVERAVDLLNRAGGGQRRRSAHVTHPRLWPYGDYVPTHLHH
jgi:HK97 family phage prohead protease